MHRMWICICVCVYASVNAKQHPANYAVFFPPFSFVFVYRSIRLVPVLKAKWKGLRDMFRVEIKRIPRNDAGDPLIQPEDFESKWTHYRSLLFLGM